MTEDPLTDIRFWAQVMGDAQRIVLCPPDIAPRLQAAVDARGLAGLIEVRASSVVPENTLLVVDEGAVQASMAELLQRQPPMRFCDRDPDWRWPWP